LLDQAERGEIELHTSEVILAEVVHVLRSQVTYSLDRAQVTSLLRPLVKTVGLALDHKDSILIALDLFETRNLELEDCLEIAHAQRSDAGRIYSYDRDFDKMSGTTRLEP
jgi:predicted nucleic acid-binding protein